MTGIFDIGNTRLKAFKTAGGEEIESCGSCCVPVNTDSDGYELEKIICRMQDCDSFVISGSGRYDEIKEHLAKGYPDAKTIEIRGERYKELTIPVKIDHTPLETLGADRLANICAVPDYANKFKTDNRDSELKTIIVADAGTALTLDAVEIKENGAHQHTNGTISCGLAMRLSALHQQTARLPELEGKNIDQYIETLERTGTSANNTRKAMIEGALAGMASEIMNFPMICANRTNGEVSGNKHFRIILTGGDAPRLYNFICLHPYFRQNLKDNITHIPNFQAFGLYKLYRLTK